MSLRNKIDIVGKTHKVKWAEPNPGTDTLGTYNYALQTITLEKGMPEDLAQSTMLHEILEGLDAILKLHLPHPTLDRLEAGLYSVLKGAGIDLKKLLEVKG